MKKTPPQTDSTPSRTQKLVSIGSIAAFALLLAFLAVFVGGPLIKTLGDPAAFRAWIAARGDWGKLLFVGMTTLQVVVAFIPGEPFEIAAGYAFGALEGTLLTYAGLIAGSAITFLIARKLGVRALEAIFPRKKINSVKFLQNKKALYAAGFALFFIPGTPKDLLSYAAGLTSAQMLPWLLVTSLARLPSVVTSTVSGDALGTKQYLFAAIVFAATALLSGAAVIVYRSVQKKRALREAAEALAARPLPVAPDPAADDPEDDDFTLAR